MDPSPFRPRAFLAAAAISLGLWASIGYAAGVRPVHLGLRRDLHAIAHAI